jgi:hypothetical protein
MPKIEARVRELKALRTSGGSTRFVLVTEDGNEYSTFREDVAASLPGLEGRRVRLDYHEQQRGRFTNVYLDGVEVLEEPAAAKDADEVAWRVAVEAAPYLLSSEAAEAETPPEEVFEKLQPFKDLVADDLEGEPEEDGAEGTGD